MSSRARYQVHLQVDEAFAGHVEPRIVRAAARAALAHEGAPTPGGLTVVLTDDQTVRALNRAHLDVDRPTDVLAFPAGQIDPDTGAPYFGDIVISLPAAQAQARAGGHPLAAEVQLLVVHGVLHLLGHDHGSDAEKARMWDAQASILESLKVSLAEYSVRAGQGPPS